MANDFYICDRDSVVADEQHGYATQNMLSMLNVSAQQNAAYNAAILRAGLQNAYVRPAVARLSKAQAIAAEVRARRPEMQVRKIG